MADDFKPSKPQIQTHWGVIDEPIDTKDRTKSQGFWLKDKLTSNGQQYLTGTNKTQGRRFISFIAEGWKLVKVDASEAPQQDEAEEW